MPWKETHVEQERMRFMTAYLDEGSGWSVTELCTAFSIARKTGYKWIERYEREGLNGLNDRSRAAHSHPNATDSEIVQALLRARGKHRFWGPRKLLAWLRRQQPATAWPAVSTAGDILRRHGLVQARRQRRRLPIVRPPIRVPTEPNDTWAVDYKGWFRTGDGQRCEPLTISDVFSRYLLECQRVTQTNTRRARAVFEMAFRTYGLPAAIRSDNGAPFASHGLAGLSVLSVWWVKLGIRLERIEPGHPEQNGRHERLHQTLKRETATPPQATLAAQQRAFNTFRLRYNTERPHEALQDTPPAQWYVPSERTYPEREPSVEYPASFEVRQVRSSGEIKWGGELLYVSQALIGEPIGLEPISDRHWRLYFAQLPLALFDDCTRRLLPYRLPVSPSGEDPATAPVVENSSRPTGSFRSPQPFQSELQSYDQ